MTEEIVHRILGSGKHYLGFALLLAFGVVVVVFMVGFVLPTLRAKSDAAKKYLPGNTAAGTDHTAASSAPSVGFGVA